MIFRIDVGAIEKNKEILYDNMIEKEVDFTKLMQQPIVALPNVPVTCLERNLETPNRQEASCISIQAAAEHKGQTSLNWTPSVPAANVEQNDETSSLKGNLSVEKPETKPQPFRRKFDRSDFASESVYQEFLRYQTYVEQQMNSLKCKDYPKEKQANALKDLIKTLKHENHIQFANELQVGNSILIFRLQTIKNTKYLFFPR